MNKTIFQTAQDEWPEDEARQVFNGYKEALDDSGLEYAEKCLAKDLIHFQLIFGREKDGVELMERFKQEISRLKTA
jgi:hypothetical protein